MIKTLDHRDYLAKVKSAADGTCYIEAFLDPDRIVAHANIYNFWITAVAVDKACVEDKRPSQGGVASGLGKRVTSISPKTSSHECLGDGGLNLFIAEGYPSVRCHGTAPTLGLETSCNGLLNTEMYTSSEARTFGNQGSGADFELPYTWDGSSSRRSSDVQGRKSQWLMLKVLLQ